MLETLSAHDLLQHLDTSTPTPGSPSLTVGVDDQGRAHHWEPARHGNLALISSPGRGRTSLARALLAQLLRQSPTRPGPSPLEERTTQIEVLGLHAEWSQLLEISTRMTNAAVGPPQVNLTLAREVDRTATVVQHLAHQARRAYSNHHWGRYAPPTRLVFLIADDLDLLLDTWADHLDDARFHAARQDLRTLLSDGPTLGFYTLATGTIDRWPTHVPEAFGLRMVDEPDPRPDQPGTNPLTLSNWRMEHQHTPAPRRLRGAYIPPSDLRGFLSH